MLGKAFMADVTTRDHENKIYTATFTSIGRYLSENNLLSQAIILEANKQVPLI
jgi:hypothetical protein